MTMQQLQSFYNRLLLQNYESSVNNLRIPTMGGYVELNLSFNNGLVNVTRATKHITGVTTHLDHMLGYTCEVGLARMTKKVLDESPSDCIVLREAEQNVKRSDMPSVFLTNDFPA